MSIETPSGALAGDLARVKSQEANDEWPEMIEIVAYWAPGRKKRKSVTISANQFFGRGEYSAPMTGDQLILIMERLRRAGG